MPDPVNNSDSTGGVDPVAVGGPKTIRVFDKKVMIVMPWHKQVSPITAFCAAQLMDKRRTHSVLNFGDAFISHSRNTCADIFLKSDLEWALWIDDDMLIPFGSSAWFRSHTGWDWYPEQFAALNAIDRLMSAGKSLVGALYFGRHPGGPPVFNEGRRPEMLKLVRGAPLDRVVPTRWVGTGCLLTHRSVFADIETRFPLLRRGIDGKGGHWFTSSEALVMDHLSRVKSMLSAGPMTGEKACKAYEMLVSAEADAKGNSTLGMGEDVSFCLRAQQAGHQPHVDLGLVCGHIGSCCYGPRNTK